MLHKFDDIERALKAKAYLAALALALTLPDICGKIAYPEIAKPSIRYVKWYDEYLTKYDYPPDFDERLKFDGLKCWKLRCAFLHEGSIKGMPDIHQFRLCINEQAYLGSGPSSYDIHRSPNQSPTYSIEIDVAQLCYQVLSCAKGFYNEYADKSVFDDQNIIIENINSKIDKLEEAGFI